MNKKQLNSLLERTNTEIFSVKAENTIQYVYEKELEAAIAKIFHRMRKGILKNLKEYYSEDIMLNVHADLILSPIHELHKKYYETIMRYKNREYRKGKTQAKRLVARAKRYAKNYGKMYGSIKADTTNIPMSSIIKKDELFATSEFSAEHMRDKTFVASENTLARVDKDINGIITEGYRDGWGINDVGNRIETRFNQLETWEARRIARTEIHGSHMQGIMQTYTDMGVEYTQWAAAHDSRTRDTHSALDGEIIPMGGTYSNGLRYPGDTNGPLKEWINCRCGNLPWFCPPGMMVPVGMTNFRESDLLPLGTLGTGGDILNNIPQESVFDETKFAQLRTNEEIADFFGYEYIPKGRYYENIDAKTFEFYDKENDVYLRFFREGEHKCSNIDFTNKGKGEYDLKEVLRIYEETHSNLKVGLDDIEFKHVNRDKDIFVAGEAHRHSASIYDMGLITKRDGGLESTLDHELGHVFENTMLLKNEYRNGNKELSLTLKPKLEKTRNADIKFHNEKGIKIHSISNYGTENPTEEFAELISQSQGIRRGRNWNVDGERIKIPDETRPKGYRRVRDNPTLLENQQRNPNRFKFADDLVDHPEKVNPNWKAETQARVKASRQRFNKLLKEEQSVVYAKKVQRYDRYKLSNEGESVYKNLKNKENLLFPERQLLKRLDSLNEFNELHNKKLSGKIFDEELEKTYQKLKKRYGDYVQLDKIDLKSVKVKNRGLFKNENAFELTKDEQKLYNQLNAQNKLWQDKLPQKYKSTYLELSDKQELSRLHQKMLDYRLTAEQSDSYIDLYYKYKEQWKLPKINLKVADKFTIKEPYFLNHEKLSEIETISNKFKLTPKQQEELDNLNKTKFLNNGKLTKTQEKKLDKLLAQKDFNDLYSLRIQNKGLNYSNNRKYKQAYETLKKHKYKFPKNSQVELFQDLTPKNQFIKVEWKEPINGKYKHLKGAYDDGLTPELRSNFDEYFTIDCRNLTPHQKEHLDIWLVTGHNDISEFLRQGEGDIHKFAEWYIKQEGNVGVPLEKAIEIGRQRKYICDIIEDILDNSYLKKPLVGYRRQRNHHLMDYLPQGEDIIPGKTVVPLKGVSSIAVTEEGATYYVEKAGKTLEEMKWLFEIEMPAGTKGTYVSHVTIDKYKPEMEFLARKDTYVRILEFDEKNHYAKLRVINNYK